MPAKLDSSLDSAPEEWVCPVLGALFLPLALMGMLATLSSFFCPNFLSCEVEAANTYLIGSPGGSVTHMEVTGHRP